MTLSQMELLSRAVALQEIDDYQTLLAIAHNPYAKSAGDAKKLGRILDQTRDALERGVMRGTDAMGNQGVKVADLWKKFGPIARVELSREEWERMEDEREAAAERARAKGMRVPERKRRPFPARQAANGDRE